MQLLLCTDHMLLGGGMTSWYEVAEKERINDETDDE